MTVKERIIEAIRELPDEADFEQAMDRLYLLYKVERGLKQADAGDKVSHAEAGRRIAEWLK